MAEMVEPQSQLAALEQARESRDVSYLRRYVRDQMAAERMAQEAPGTHVWVNGCYAHVEPPTLFEQLFGFRL
jgi:hypothetical protein